MSFIQVKTVAGKKIETLLGIDTTFKVVKNKVFYLDEATNSIASSEYKEDSVWIDATEKEIKDEIEQNNRWAKLEQEKAAKEEASKLQHEKEMEDLKTQQKKREDDFIAKAGPAASIGQKVKIISEKSKLPVNTVAEVKWVKPSAYHSDKWCYGVEAVPGNRIFITNDQCEIIV